MHDARRVKVAASKRLSLALLAALMLAGAAVVARPVANLSICSAYTPDDVEWYLFFCYLDPPPKDPRT